MPSAPAGHDIPPAFFIALVSGGLRAGTPAGLASAVRAVAALATTPPAPPPAGDLAADLPLPLVAVEPQPDWPDPAFDWLYQPAARSRRRQPDDDD